MLSWPKQSTSVDACRRYSALFCSPGKHLLYADPEGNLEQQPLFYIYVAYVYICILHMYIYKYLYNSNKYTNIPQKATALQKKWNSFCEISHTNYIPTPSIIIFWNTFRLCFLIHAMWVFLHQKHIQIHKFWCQLLHRAELLMFANWFFFPWNTGSAWRGK